MENLMNQNTPRVLAVAEVAALLNCTEETVCEWARRGLLPGLKAGRQWVFPAGALCLRLDALALEQAALRREPQAPSAVQHPAPASGMGATGRKRRQPPKLPGLPTGQGKTGPAQKIGRAES